MSISEGTRYYEDTQGTAIYFPEPFTDGWGKWPVQQPLETWDFTLGTELMHRLTLDFSAAPADITFQL